MANIKLEDILAGQHLSPFTLAEFEEHLVHVQHSVENLYFYFWLADYTKQYREWEAGLDERKDSLVPLPTTLFKPIDCLSNMRPARKGVLRFVPTFLRKMTKGKKDKVDDEPQVHQVQLSSIPDQSCMVPMKAPAPEDLKKAFESLRAFVLSPKSHQPFHEILDGFELELNISQQLKDRFRLEAQTSIHPDIFLPIKKEVINMLSDSMRIWLGDCSGNSDNHHH